MPIEFTRHPNLPSAPNRSQHVDAPRGQTGDVERVEDGASDAFTETTLVRIYAVNSCRVRIGKRTAALADASAGELWEPGERWRWVRTGESILCSELA